MIKRILVPVDGSEHALKAIRLSSDLVGQSHATVHLLHVIKRVGIPQEIGEYIESEGIKDEPHAVYLRLVGDHIMGAAEEEARKKGITHIEKSVIPGDPADEIIRYAKDHGVDMIFLGTRGLGSVSGKVCSETDRTCVLVRKTLLEDKKILIVDDEPDVLDTLEELLDMCDVVKAVSFDQARALLEEQRFDMAILDIMGVDGYKLLEIANQRKVVAVMLTAHALSPEDTVKSYRGGAASYIPKDKLDNIVTYLNDILEAQEKGKHFWWRWFDRFGSYYERKFGSELRDKIKVS